MNDVAQPHTDNGPTIDVEGVTHCYKKNLPVLSEINLSLGADFLVYLAQTERVRAL